MSVFMRKEFALETGKSHDPMETDMLVRSQSHPLRQRRFQTHTIKIIWHDDTELPPLPPFLIRLCLFAPFGLNCVTI